ncbi:DUF427 domain-containing protein [Marinobacter sp. 1Y8]
MTDTETQKQDHPHAISVESSTQRVKVIVAGLVIADSADGKVLHEKGLNDVLYLPRKDVVMTELRQTDHSTHCPFKGDATYFSIPAGGERSANAVWSYESPLPGAEAIQNHLAFYPDRVTRIETIPV